ncbi:hypothetical protein N9453_02170 [Aquiluna sp.]|nr:hypothetical protein [Aquiluna sp.]
MFALKIPNLKLIGLGAAAVVLALIASSFGPPEKASAFAPGDVTKTITVSGADGSPYGAGALVAFILESGNSETLSIIATTNASGVAEVDISGTADVLGLAVSPALSDSTNALYFAENGEGLRLTPSDQSFAVQLEAADITANLITAGASAAPNGSIIQWFGGESGARMHILRAGAVGIALPGAAESFAVGAQGGA